LFPLLKELIRHFDTIDYVHGVETGKEGEEADSIRYVVLPMHHPIDLKANKKKHKRIYKEFKGYEQEEKYKSIFKYVLYRHVTIFFV